MRTYNNQSDFISTCLISLFWLIPLICWIVNLVKLLRCDFDAPYKEEFIHAIGLIPFASLFTCWY